MSNNKNQMQAFNEKLFIGRKVKWFDNQGIFTMNEDKRAVIMFVSTGYQNCYNGYDVQIVHKNTGQIASKLFKFDDYMAGDDRADKRPDYKCDSNNRMFYAWFKHDNDGSTLDWYIAVPTDAAVRRVTDRIFDYIEMWM